MSDATALIARHRKACLDFATCEPKDADRLGREVFAAAQALEAALIEVRLDMVLSDNLCDAYGVPRGSTRRDVTDDVPPKLDAWPFADGVREVPK